MTSAVPDAPKEAPKDIPNPLQNFFGEPTDASSLKAIHVLAGLSLLLFPSTTSIAGSCLIPSCAPEYNLFRQAAQMTPRRCLAEWSPHTR